MKFCTLNIQNFHKAGFRKYIVPIYIYIIILPWWLVYLYNYLAKYKLVNKVIEMFIDNKKKLK